MKKWQLYITLVSGLLFWRSGYSQVRFESGYFVTNEGVRTECQILNKDWKNNPKSFQFRKEEGGEVSVSSIEATMEFGIAGGATYRRNKVDIDKSTESLDGLVKSRNPEFIQETLFLKVLVEGKATLYQYDEENLLRFFYSVDQGSVSQLVYKMYQLPDGKVARNEMYKQQVMNDLKCECLKETDARRLKYTIEALTSYFESFNNANGSTLKGSEKVGVPDLFKLRIRPGVSSNSLQVASSYYFLDENYGQQMAYRIGIEAEFIMPFNKNKWAIILEPGYSQYQSSPKNQYYTLTAEYRCIEINAGVRHYFFLGENSRIFINGGIRPRRRHRGRRR